MITGIELIADERKRQADVEGFSLLHDIVYEWDELARAAACYATPPDLREAFGAPLLWPFDESWWKPSPDDRIKELTKAGALIAAELDRLINREHLVDEKNDIF